MGTKETTLIYRLSVSPSHVDMHWGFIPNELWTTILKEWARQYVDGIGFEGYKTKAQLTQISRFAKWQPDIQFHCCIRSKLVTQIKTEVLQPQEMAVFSYSEKVREVIEAIEFNDWDVTYDENPVDSLYFFKGERLIMDILPYESEIMVYVTDSERDALIQLDDRIRQNLFRKSDLIVSVDIVSR